MRTTALSSALLLAPFLAAQRIAEIEPNDSPATAQVLALGTQVDCSLVAGEADWFRFTTAGGNVRIYVNGAIDSQLELRDAGGAVVLAFSDDVRGTQSDLTIDLAAGTYLCRIDGYSAAVAGPYSLDLGELAAKPFTAAEVEPNHGPGLAQGIGNGAQVDAALDDDQFVPIVTANSSVAVAGTDSYTLGAGAWTKTPQPGNRITVAGFANAANNGLKVVTAASPTTITVSTAPPHAPLAPEAAGPAVSIDAGDEDWYRLVLTTQSVVWFQVTEGRDSCIPRSRYEIYDGTGALVPAVTHGSNAADSSIFNFRQSNLRVWPAGTYYYVVEQSNATSAANTTMSPFARYRLELLVQPMLTGGAVVENPEPNQSAATATALSPGQAGIGNLSASTGDPSDWWGPFSFAGPSLITCQTTQGAAPALLDSTIQLRDAATGALLASALSGNLLTATSHARLHASGNSPIAFYVEVLSPGALAGQSGNYELQVSSIDPLPYVSASYTNLAGNASCGQAPRPQLTTAFANERPVLGTVFSRTLGPLAPGAPFFLLQGFSNAAGNGGTVPLPFALDPLGAPSCAVHVDPLATVLSFAGPSGSASLDQAIASSIALRGMPLYEQAAVLAPAANPLGIQMSNHCRQLWGERSW
ncbi:MAG: hypothetical protein FJ265_17155 [Planctomycetes bacterium]|nr:hypothetical protein [Planctomycetota bacterium]